MRKSRIKRPPARLPVPAPVQHAMNQYADAARKTVLFEQQDMEHALKIYDDGVARGDRRKAMLDVMMFALQAAAVNLGVPQR